MGERPDVLRGYTIKINTGYGHLYCTINETDDGKPCELFAVVGKSGQSTHAKAEALGRLISLLFKNNVPILNIHKQLDGIVGANPTITKSYGSVRSLPDAIAKCIAKYMKIKNIELPEIEEKVTENKSVPEVLPVSDGDTKLGNGFEGKRCPECGSHNLKHEGGCVGCLDCNWEKCG